MPPTGIEPATSGGLEGQRSSSELRGRETAHARPTSDLACGYRAGQSSPRQLQAIALSMPPCARTQAFISS